MERASVFTYKDTAQAKLDKLDALLALSSAKRNDSLRDALGWRQSGSKQASIRGCGQLSAPSASAIRTKSANERASIFFMALPRCMADGTVVSWAADRNDWGLKLDHLPVISIVDADESVREATKSLVRSLGYKVETFGSAAEFLESAIWTSVTRQSVSSTWAVTSGGMCST
jgi:hypothetical protein